MKLADLLPLAFRIEALEENYRALAHENKFLMEKIEALQSEATDHCRTIQNLEQHKNYQIDENRKISARVDGLSSIHDKGNYLE